MPGKAGYWCVMRLQAVRLLTSNGSAESAMSDRRESQDQAHSISFGLAAGDGSGAPSWLECLLAEDDSAASGPADHLVERPRASAQPVPKALTSVSVIAAHITGETCEKPSVTHA